MNKKAFRQVKFKVLDQGLKFLYFGFEFGLRLYNLVRVQARVEANNLIEFNPTMNFLKGRILLSVVSQLTLNFTF